MNATQNLSLLSSFEVLLCSVFKSLCTGVENSPYNISGPPFRDKHFGACNLPPKQCMQLSIMCKECNPSKSINEWP